MATILKFEELDTWKQTGNLSVKMFNITQVKDFAIENLNEQSITNDKQ